MGSGSNLVAVAERADVSTGSDELAVREMRRSDRGKIGSLSSSSSPIVSGIAAGSLGPRT
jgi:hypothetical protein